MRDVFIDHVAVGSWTGRCSYPLCGIGINGKLKGANPYPNEHSCRLRKPEMLDIVGSGERKHNGKTYSVIFGKPGGKLNLDRLRRLIVIKWKHGVKLRLENCEAHGGSFEPAKGEKKGCIKRLKQEKRGMA